MRINWGTGLFIFFTLFVLTLGFVLYKSRQIDNSLVIDKYYEEDIKYQQHYDKLKNLQDTGKDLIITISKESQEVELAFPHPTGQLIEGEILFYRAAAKNEDIKIPLHLTNDSILVIPTHQLSPGKWKIKVDWTTGNIPYFKETDIYL
ncbi:MAG: FixH family protein [Saprospiraceae bacterium]|nr:FixH family protein [Saprospiraceae bacterium]